MKKRYFALAIPILLAVGYLAGPSVKKPIYNLELPEITDAQQFVKQKESALNIKNNNHAEIVWADSTQSKTEYALLYLHGFTASKQEGSPVYLDFAKRYNCNVFAARLAEHGLAGENPMINYTADGVWNSAKEALVIAQQLGEKVIVMSTSTGGTLALKLAAEYPGKISGLINLSPNIGATQWNSYLLNQPWGLQIARSVLGGDYRTIDGVDERYAKFWYKSYRIECLPEVQELVESTMNEDLFERVTCPVINLYYYKDEENQDQVVDVERIKWMHNSLATAHSEKRLMAIENAQTHVIGCGFYSKAIPEVEKAIFSFSEEVLMLNPITFVPE